MSNPSFRSTSTKCALTTWWRAISPVPRICAMCCAMPTTPLLASRSIAPKRETLRTPRDLMPPAEISSATQQEWHDRALELLAAGELS